ncbi:9706_t:CDS:2, partial [Funneliformis geosporum]
AKCFLPEVGSILWSGPLGPIIICVARQAVDRSLNCQNDPGNKSLWCNHLPKLGTLAVMDRVNKREIRSIAVQEETERYKNEQASKFSGREGTSEKKSKKRKVTASKNEMLSSDNNDEDDEEIKIDLKRISDELLREPEVKWEVGCINVTDQFRRYQKEIIEKAEKNGLKYDNIYELLALSSIIVLSCPCPYPTMFTIAEWQEITRTNPYTPQDSPLTQDILLSLHDASFNHFLGLDSFVENGESKLSKIVARSFNDIYDSVMKVAPLKMSEEEHCLNFVYPLARPFFSGEKEYELILNRANTGTKKRPDLSCVVDGVPILNSEFKPLGCTPLQRGKDRVKVQLRARKSVNQQLLSKGGPGDLMESYFMDLEYDGLYRSWPFLTTRLVIDKTTIPLAGVAIHHLLALEERVEKISKDFKYRKSRSGETTPLQQLSFIRTLPDSPQ